ncbi:M14 family metallopeptidase [Amycolatopsis tucumanensis]|uniref:Succinylglutamate desuccinylase/aspartoacylase family protein n=1 Tax=Amycolatopsis tucumanensis TaxID=401106 RepID=A0ABP7I5K1_9PSEU|nr:M14 family metallopeptidase [Amycolatopsis tucumanensis]
MLAVLRVVRELAGIDLSGTVLAVARAHPAAWAAASRTSPLDGENLARSFPGAAHAGPTAAVAAGLTSEVLLKADVLIDLHSAGSRYSMPLFCGFSEGHAASRESRTFAEAFGAPMIWQHPRPSTGRSLSVAAERGIPSIYAECSGGGEIRKAELDAYVRGVLSVMAANGMVSERFTRSPAAPAQWVHGTGDLDSGMQSGCDGLFVTAVGAGAFVQAGAEIGHLYTFDGDEVQAVCATKAGFVMFLRRQARVRRGDVLFVMADASAENRSGHDRSS